MALYRIREMMFGTREVFEYFMCSECGCLQIKEIPEHLERFYPQGYYAHQAGNTGSSPFWLKRYLQKKRSKAAIFGVGYRLNHILGRFVEYPNSLHRVGPILQKAGIRGYDANFLDVGCGTRSWWLENLRALGFRRLMGVDPFVPDLPRSRSISVFRGTIQGISGQFSMITYHHSFEHIPDQVAEMQQVARRMKDDGVCLIRVPVVSSHAWERYGVDWVELDAPRHLYMHSGNSLKYLGKRAGLDLVDVVCDTTEFEFIGSEQYRRNIALHENGSYHVDPKTSCFRPEDVERFRKEAERLNLQGRGGRAAFYFRKMSAPAEDKDPRGSRRSGR